MGSPDIYHMGESRFADRIWKVEQADTYTVRLSYLSPDGENGFPGNLKVTLVYSLGEDENALDLTYEATTDAPTVLNLSHHSFLISRETLQKRGRPATLGRCRSLYSIR